VNVLVTGGAGFIGSHIADACVEAGHQVVVVDNLATGKTTNVNPRATFHKLDIRDPALAALFAAEQFDVVLHQAALCDVRASMADPITYAEVNVQGGINLLECSRLHGVKKIVFASTGGCVYGNPRYLPADEDHPILPLDPYGASKASFELYLHGYHENYGLRYTILRYANIYGPRQDPFGEAGVISIFIGKMLRGEQAVINGDGEQTRDFVFVHDVVRANMLAMEQGDGEVYNLGGGNGTTVNTIFHELKALTGYAGEEVHGPPRLGEVQHNYLSAEKIGQALGWKAATSLTEGLRQTVEFFRPLI
jgi:UDP-glucose 4-epimerase